MAREREEFTRQVLLKGTEAKKYKFTYTEKDLTKDKIIGMIENKSIDITAPCFAERD